MRNFNFLLLLISVFILTSCAVEPEPIIYGDDQCDFCKMNVVDKAHASQYVTSKGKQFKFDAIECLVREIGSPDIQESDLAYILVADYSEPGSMIDASKATFIVCKAIKSPMGAYLSAFSNAEDAKSTVAENGGEVFTWEEIKTHINKK